MTTTYTITPVITTRTLVESGTYRLVVETRSGERRIESGRHCSEWLDGATCDAILADPSLMAGMRVDEPIDDDKGAD